MSTELPPGWYVRIQGQILGPLSDAELQQLARDGGLASEDAISADCVVWQPVTVRWPQLGPRQAAPLIVTTASPDKLSTSPAALGAVVMLGVGLLVLVLCCAGGIALSPSVPETPAAVAMLPGQATWDYWSAAQQVIVDAQTASQSTTQKTQGLDEAASRLAQLPTVGVDADAVSVVLDCVAVLRQVTTWSQRQSDPGLLVEAFFRGAQGDLFGTALEQRQQWAVIDQNAQQVRHQAVTVRAVLSQRYGRELPPLGF
ncbi:MAG TPA: GYF domain-containing protein [Planctomycetaceae bacterium]|nr:GYF domain-containing protein [Planctomycetaceae bacterium]